MIHCILDKPSVTLRMDPPSPISELDRRNVTLFCDIVSGYPSILTRVNWYMDGNLLKELPDCPDDLDFGGFGENGANDLCDIDPSKLLLEHVSKLFHGNYSCEAANEAGWSDMSELKQLEIYCKYSIHTWLRPLVHSIECLSTHATSKEFCSKYVFRFAACGYCGQVVAVISLLVGSGLTFSLKAMLPFYA